MVVICGRTNSPNVSITNSYKLGRVFHVNSGKFLKKLWCCVGGEYYKIICFNRVGS